MYAKNKFNYYYLVITIQNVVPIKENSSKIIKIVHNGLFVFFGNIPSIVEFLYVIFFIFLLIYILYIYF